MSKAIAIKNEITKKFKEFILNGRIFLIKAPCGFGKTAVAKTLVNATGLTVCEMRGDETDFDRLMLNPDWDILLLDDMQMIKSKDEHQKLCNLIRTYTNKRFVLLTRGSVWGELVPFKISGLLTQIDENDLFMDKQTVADFFGVYNITPTETELNTIMNITLGYPLAIEMLAERLENNEQEYNSRLSDQIKGDIFMYFDEMIFTRFELSIRRFLLELAPFGEFTMELAKMVSGNSDAGIMLSWLQRNTSMMRFDGNGNYQFWELFREFLMWEQERVYTSEQQRALLSRGGLYWELHNDYVKALEFYSKSGEQNKVSELIIKIMSLHPGMGHYEELENYFDMLSDDVIKQSPALMQGKSMLCSLHTYYDQSEQWYNSLKEFANGRKGLDAAAKEAKNRLLWLDIALPQREVSGLINTISRAFGLITNKEAKMMPFSVTSTLPSIMNGGKDFSAWSKKDDLLYKTMKIPVEAVLGKDGVCLADCAIAESKFEKGDDISDKILLLISKLGEIQNRGTPDIEFAVVGLLVRNQLDAGKCSDARHTLNALRERFAKQGNTRFLPNIDAMLCRIALRENNTEFTERWYRDKAPRNSLKISVMKRYQYFTEAMTELALGDNDAALLTLSPLLPYCQRCARHIDLIHLKTISAIANRRKGSKSWQSDLKQAVSIAEEFGFIRTISCYGAAILPLLNELYSGDEKLSPFIKKVIKATRGQAVYYPDFLKPKNTCIEKLTESEIQVLRLLCADKSNQEIGEILDIRLATVKSHVSHILQKLGVSRRSEAKTKAHALRLIN